MTTAAVNYAKVLYELGTPQTAVREAQELFRKNPELVSCLENPLTAFGSKERVVDRIFPTEIRTFIKVVCRHRRIMLWQEIFQEYQELCQEAENVIKAVLIYVTPPDEKQEKGIKEFLCRECKVKAVDLKLVQDQSLIGGFILEAGGKTYDWSLRGRYHRLEEKLTRR